MTETPGKQSGKSAARGKAAGRTAGRKPDFRNLDGILLPDKPDGLSSNQALQRVRCHEVVIVHELEIVAAGLGHATIARHRRTGVFLAEIAKGKGHTLRTRPPGIHFTAGRRTGPRHRPA